MKDNLILLALLLVSSLVIYGPQIHRELKERRIKRRQWQAVRRQRLSDMAKNKHYKPRVTNYRPTVSNRSDRRQTPPKPSNINKPPPQTQPQAIAPRKPPAPRPVPPQLLWKLDELTKDSKASQRLVDGVARAHPGKSRKWCTEKAISDLERDRFR